MAAKRIVAELHILDGRVVAKGGGADLGSATLWARRLEMEGADELIFVEAGAHRPGQAWVAEVARSLFIPFALEAAFQEAGDAAAALEAGADRVVMAAGDFQRLRAGSLGRARVMAALDVAWNPASGWAEAVEAMVDLGLAGAGEILLRAGSSELGELCRRLARLPMPILLRCSDPGLAVEALAHGADGIAFPAGLRSAAEFKELLAPAGVLLRR